MKFKIIALISIISFIFAFKPDNWSSKFLHINQSGHIAYNPDEKGNSIPDFSAVGYYHGYKPIPNVKIVKVIAPIEGDNSAMLQNAINEVAKLPLNSEGFRGTLFLKKGIYKIQGALNINTDGIVIKGEGDNEDGTILIATGDNQRSLIKVFGKGKIKEIQGTRTTINNSFVPIGSKSFEVQNVSALKTSDRIILYRPATQAWIHDLKMDQIFERAGTNQWKAKDYNLSYEREITAIDGNKITIDNPIVMQLDQKYGGGEIYKYTYEGRISNIGIESLLFKSEYVSAIDENHGWIAIEMDHLENGWVKEVTSKYFGYACVSLDGGAKNITVTDSKCFDAKSIITGGRRYSFNNDGQQNLLMNLETTEGRHDFVTGAKTCGPNVFYNCKARNTHADIGSHHRWSSGTLYDNIDTDGEINIQDRGNWGSGHGWSGVTQVVWNSKVSGATVQQPWVSGNNYVIGLQGKQLKGRFSDRLNGEWEGLNRKGLIPTSLYLAQLKDRK
ncbi:: hypothetical protein [Arcticibacter svalbardensis MN12-7]|uniref:Pectate lyase superfamily protein domain-containing protein n=1 Tax=Arcticibacter svalbardensis MN12-7 TaxID=1150600 RepID=R9GP89_9SPHI|nr:hypothetical protein [Arcticibacter svalbardensis]EOR93538.1 : hypothetical protein [Arcticibacter svalbardensis MN12-7]